MTESEDSAKPESLQIILKGLHILGPLLILIALAVTGAGALLQWRLNHILSHPLAIAAIGSEKQLVNSIQESTVALLNTNDQVSFTSRMKDIRKSMDEWQPIHMQLVEATHAVEMPGKVRNSLQLRVFPLYDELVSVINDLLIKVESGEDRASLLELKPYVKEIQSKTEIYLFNLDHLDLLLADITHKSIQQMLSFEGVLIVAVGLLLLATALWLYFPTSRTLKALFDKQKNLLEQIRTRNVQLTELQTLIKDRLQLALEVSRTGTFVWKQSTNELSWDHNLSNLYGINSPELVKKAEDFISMVHEDDRAKVRDHVQKTLEYGEDTVEFRIKVSGNTRWIRDRSRAIPRPGEMTIIGACTDETVLMGEIENAHQSELEAERANKSKTEFITSMSHDMRTPLSAILGFTEILKKHRDLTEAKISNYLERIFKNGQWLLEMIEELLDTSRIESGEESVHIQKFNINQLLNEVQDSHSQKIQEKNLDFAVYYHDTMPEDFIGDPVLLKRVLDNFISNAIRYSDRGKISLEVSMLRPKPGNEMDTLQFRIIDQGRGIDPKNRARVFEAFTPRQQVNDSTKSTGLGLYIARKLASLMGGNVSLEWSEVGKGSEFIFTVPVKVTKSTAREKATSINRSELRVVRPDSSDLSELSVLMVEDSPDVRYMHEIFLNDVHITPTLAEDGEEALKILSEEKFDLVLMDIGLPGMNGIDVTRNLRNRGYNGAIIALSAHAFGQEKERALQAGCNLYLTKPIKIEELHQVLKKELGKKQSSLDHA